MDYDSGLHEPRTNAEQSETGGDFRVSFESLIRGKKLAPPHKKPNPLDYLLEHAEHPYWLRFDRVEEEWHVAWDGRALEPLARFAADEEETAVAFMRWLAAKWRETAGRKVYFIGTACRIGARVKIGIAYSPRKRLSALRTASYEPLEILATVRGGREDEARLHRKFSRSRLAGEWFRITPALKRLIEETRASPKPSQGDTE